MTVFGRDLSVTAGIRLFTHHSHSRKMSIWRAREAVWSCRDFRVTRCPGVRSEPCCSKRSASSDATPSSSTWSSGGSLCTGGSGARTPPGRRWCTRRWVRGVMCEKPGQSAADASLFVNWLIEDIICESHVLPRRINVSALRSESSVASKFWSLYLCTTWPWNIICT